jgi:hypothetical protein
MFTLNLKSEIKINEKLIRCFMVMEAVETPEQLMWDLNTDDYIKNVTWWWWWWLFFIKNRDDPKHWKQLMILWSIKDTKKIKVMDHVWTPKGKITKSKNSLRFPGMVCAWFYDGKKMHDPYIIQERSFKSTWEPKEFSKKIKPNVVSSGDDTRKGKKVTKVFTAEEFDKVGPGILKAENEDNYIFSGTPTKYNVKIQEGEDKFNFIIEPMTGFMSEPEFTFRKYVGKYGYTIYRIKGMRLGGEMTVRGKKEQIDGSAYFQKIKLNSPAVPWYWGIFHFEGAGHLHYMMPHSGPPMFRKKSKPKSKLDWGEIKLSKTLDFFNAKEKKLYHFDKLKLKKDFTTDELPIFKITGTNDAGQRLVLNIESYARAYWRFEQKTTIKTRIFFYNEYPANITNFTIHSQSGDKLVDLSELGDCIGHCEHSWGRLA